MMRTRMGLVCFAGLALSLAMPAARLAAADEMTVDSAIECLADEDAATRKKAEEFLRAQGDKAIPALKKAMESNDPEIRKRAAALLTIAKRAPVVVKVVDQAGKPIAGVEFSVVVIKPEDSDKVWMNGGAWALNQVKPLYTATLKSDAEGMIKTEELNQERYAVCLGVTEGLPMQTTKLDVEIKDGTAPSEWKAFRGSGVKIKIVDENDKPVSGAVMMLNERWGEFSIRDLENISDRKLAKRLENAPAEMKSTAEGTVQLKNLMHVPGTATVFQPGYARVTLNGVKAEDGKETDLGVVKLVPVKKAKVTVTLVDKDMKPLKGLTVIAVDAENRYTLRGYVEGKQLAKVLEWKYANSAGPSDDAGKASVDLAPGAYAFAVANGESSSLTWVSTVVNGVDMDCGTVVLP